MATLVIGAGLVGAQIARLLVEQGERPVLIDHAPQRAALGEIVDLERVTLAEGDVLRPLALMQVLRAHGITAVAHTAANPMLTLGAQRDPHAAINLNIMGTVNVLEAARIHGARRVVISSSSVLNHFMEGGEGGGDMMKEEGFPRPTTFYAATKQAVESLGLNYARWCGTEFAALRYGAVFGPWSGQGGGGPSNMMREALRRALRGEEAVIPAGGFEWVHAADAALGTVLALRARDLASGVFNITMGVLVTPEQTAEAIRAAIPGARVRIETPAAAAVSMPDMKRASDLTLARTVLGFAPRYGLREGIAELAQWLRNRDAAAAALVS
jgi:nucleoside-diphosphate-sugar epimerase